MDGRGDSECEDGLGGLGDVGGAQQVFAASIVWRRTARAWTLAGWCRKMEAGPP